MIKIDTLHGILKAQEEIESIIPVISGRGSLLNELQARLKEIDRPEAIVLMNALLLLKSCAQVVRETNIMREEK